MYNQPSDYTQEIADRICSEIADGKSVRTICSQPDMPCRTTVFAWLRKFPEFAEAYRIATEERAESYAEELIEISDDGKNDWMEHNDPDNPGYKLNGEHFGRSRLRVDTRKWMCAKMKPKKYGEKLALGGAEDLPPVAVEKIERVLIRANPKPTDS